MCVERDGGGRRRGGEGEKGREDRRVVVVRTYDLTDEFLLTVWVCRCVGVLVCKCVGV